jgi:RNA polymerase sigma-70 factor, ECF subfamily
MSYVDLNERSMIEAARRGDEAALKELFSRCWPTAWRAAYAVTRRRDLADEVAHDALVRAATSLHSFSDGRPLSPWIRRITVNAAIDAIRREARVSDFDPEWLGDTPSSDFDWELRSAVRQLDRDRRLVVVLHYWADLTLSEIGEALDIPAGTVASRLSRALDELRGSLEVNHA